MKKETSMKLVTLADSVYALHADIDTDDLFEGIWPIPNGVSLNSYLIKGDRTVMIDLFRDWEDAESQIEGQLREAGVSLSSIDIVVLNHLEPDHTGFLAELKKRNPKLEIIATAKGIELVKSFYKITDNLRAVKSGDSLPLGNGLELLFEEAPNVHWPETMVSFERKSGVLFSCDAFGSFGKLGARVFDDEFSAEEHGFFEKEGLRYYANIVSSFSTFVQRAVEKVKPLSIKVVAPSHGIIWRTNPATIVNRYLTYAGYLNGPAEQEICVIYGTMYGNTAKGLEAVIEGIESEGVPYSLHRIPNEDVSWVLADAWKSRGIVIGMPTYEYKMFPPMAYVLDIFERKHVNNRLAFRFGSFGWVGGAKKEFDATVEKLHWELLEAVEWPGLPNADTLSLMRERGAELARRVKETGRPKAE
jgi:anaerobic nitric oxide reductase flavorubredoxin